MSLLTQVDTETLSNQTIAAALLVGTYTNTTRIRKLYINVFLDQVAGGGAYVCYATIQRAGAGSAYEAVRSVKDVPSGITSIVFNSIALTLNSTDVLKVYVLGLAADTTTPDIIYDLNEEWFDDTGVGFTALPAVTLAASQHVIVDSGTITTYTGNTPQTGDAYAVANTRLPTALTANGNMKSSLVEILTTALTETAGQIAAAFKKFFNIATPAATMDHGILVDTVTTLTNAPADSTTLTEINADVDEIITTLGVAGAGLTALGDTRIANLDATISSRTKPADTQARVTLVDTLTTYTGNTPQTGDVYPKVDTEVASIKTVTDQFRFTVANQVDANALSGGGGGGLDAAGTRAALGMATANLDTQLGAIKTETDDIAAIKAKTDVLATGTDLVNGILDELTASHTTAGTVGKAIGDVGALNVTGVNTLAGHDPGATLVKVADLGTVQTGDAFARIGVAGVGLTNLGDTRIAHLDADISTRTKPADTQARVTLVDTLTTYTGNTPQTGDVYPKVDTEVASIKTVTDQFRFTIANQVDANALSGSGLDAAAVRAAIGMVSANLDTQLAEIEGETDDIAAVKAKTDNLPASPAAVGSAMTLTSGERTAVANAHLDLASGVESSLTPRQAMRLMAAALAGKLSGAGTTTIVIRNAVADSKNRITATVDSDGNRSAVSIDLS